MKEENQRGHLHPNSQVVWQVVKAFRKLGFEVAEGPELEDEFHNFDALNVPADHPARDMQDTFWVKPLSEKRPLRTHTSAVQARFMENNEPPIRILVPGRTYRSEATDARHESQFSQIEGLLVDKDVKIGHLKGCLDAFFKELYGPEVSTRFRPSFFGFVEPGFEVDLKCFVCGNTGQKADGGPCSLCGGSGWVEMGGAGMVNPKVFDAVGVDKNVWNGFAFGFGTERLAMLRHGIGDIRLLAEGDLRLINQF